MMRIAKLCLHRIETNQVPELNDVLNKKHASHMQNMQIIVLDIDKSFQIGKETAIAVLNEIDPYVTEYALGSDSYTLADVLLTCMLARLTVGEPFFNEEVKTKRPKIYDYWLKVQERPSIRQTP